MLDKNEQATDLSTATKKIALESLLHENWNRYPNASLTELESSIANYCGLTADNIVAGPGSAAIICTLLNYFAINGKRIIINQPSYSLLEYHCNSYNITFESLLLNEKLQFDIDQLPTPDNNSVVIITSPNNPVGNTISKSELEYLLNKFPRTLFILDAVYCEFAKQDFTSLISSYSNLVVLRPFSKAFPVAGLRLGYLCSNPQMAAAFKKLMLPFSINAFTMAFAKSVLFTPAFMEESKHRVKQIISERDRLLSFIKTYFDEDRLYAYPSQGNFLLIKIYNSHQFQSMMKRLSEQGISMLYTSRNVLLQNTFRVSIGTPKENDLLLDCLVTHSNEFMKVAQQRA